MQTELVNTDANLLDKKASFAILASENSAGMLWLLLSANIKPSMFHHTSTSQIWVALLRLRSKDVDRPGISLLAPGRKVCPYPSLHAILFTLKEKERKSLGSQSFYIEHQDLKTRQQTSEEFTWFSNFRSSAPSPEYILLVLKPEIISDWDI